MISLDKEGLNHLFKVMRLTSEDLTHEFETIVAEFKDEFNKTIKPIHPDVILTLSVEKMFDWDNMRKKFDLQFALFLDSDEVDEFILFRLNRHGANLAEKHYKRIQDWSKKVEKEFAK